MKITAAVLFIVAFVVIFGFGVVRVADIEEIHLPEPGKIQQR